MHTKQRELLVERQGSTETQQSGNPWRFRWQDMGAGSVVWEKMEKCLVHQQKVGSCGPQTLV